MTEPADRLEWGIRTAHFRDPDGNLIEINQPIPHRLDAGGNSMNEPHSSRLKRPRYEMPDFVRDALLEHGLMEAYRGRPPHQQNDYIGWIRRAKRPETKEKRLAQMLAELERGDKYMKMDYRPKKRGAD